MRVLWVTPNHPDPAGAGGAGHEFELLRAMAARHDIHLITSTYQFPEEESLLPAIGVSFETVVSRIRRYPTNKALIAASLTVANPSLIIWRLRDRLRVLAQRLQQVEAARGADLIHITMGEIAPVLGVAQAPTALLLFDSYTRSLGRRLEQESMPRRRLQLVVERLRTRAWERHWYSPAAGLAAVSRVDADEVGNRIGRPVEVIENPIPDEFFAPPAAPRAPATVVFVGKLNYPPNTDAIRWLAADIWPRVVAACPAARLVVVGRGDGDKATVAEVRRTVAAAGGEVHVDVADIRPYYWEASVAIAPLRLGAGLRNKVIHAFACGAPVVATPAALEGIGVTAGREVLVAEQAADLAQHVIALLLDPPRAAETVRGAATLAEEFRSARVASRFDCWWQQTAAGGRYR